MAHTVLLTGATGMIGRCLLPGLALYSGVERIFALTRRELTIGLPKTTVIRGDLRTGLTLELLPDTSADLTTIIHAAADVRFAAGREDLWCTNVLGTENLLAFARRCPRLSRVIVLSTVHVAGKRSGTIGEQELEHECGFVNAYEESKYEAEIQLRQCMASLPIVVVRLGTIIGSSAGEIPQLAAIHQALRFYYRSLAPMIPGTPSSPVDLVPLDFAVQAILEIAFDSFQPGRTFHVCGGEDSLTLAELLDLTMECFVRFRPAWRKRSIEKPSIVDLATFDLFVRSVEEVGDEGLRHSVSVLKHFAPQLAFPKRFEDADCLSTLSRASVSRPKVRDYFPRIVETLMATGWTERGSSNMDGVCL